MASASRSGFQAIAGDGAQAAHAQARAREGLALDHVLGQSQLAADDAHLVLVQQLHGLHQVELQILRQAADVVVGLHAVLRFQNVGVDGALGEEINLVAHLAGLLLEHADELAADDLALGLGLVHVSQKVQEAVGGVHVHQVRVHLVLEHVDDLLGLALAHEPVVHVHAHEVLPDGAG